jgi:hypothetical protein
MLTVKAFAARDVVEDDYAIAGLEAGYICAYRGDYA